MQKAELGTRQKEQPGGREGGVSGTGQGFAVEGTGSRKLPRREGRILPDTVMAVLCAQLSCKSIVGWCLGRERDEDAKTESIKNVKTLGPGWTVLGAICQWCCGGNVPDRGRGGTGSLQGPFRVPSTPDCPEALCLQQ